MWQKLESWDRWYNIVLLMRCVSTRESSRATCLAPKCRAKEAGNYLIPMVPRASSSARFPSIAPRLAQIKRQLSCSATFDNKSHEKAAVLLGLCGIISNKNSTASNPSFVCFSSEFQAWARSKPWDPRETTRAGKCGFSHGNGSALCTEPVPVVLTYSVNYADMTARRREEE